MFGSLWDLGFNLSYNSLKYLSTALQFVTVLQPQETKNVGFITDFYVCGHYDLNTIGGLRI